MHSHPRHPVPVEAPPVVPPPIVGQLGLAREVEEDTASRQSGGLARYLVLIAASLALGVWFAQHVGSKSPAPESAVAISISPPAPAANLVSATPVPNSDEFLNSLSDVKLSTTNPDPEDAETVNPTVVSEAEILIEAEAVAIADESELNPVDTALASTDDSPAESDPVAATWSEEMIVPAAAVKQSSYAPLPTTSMLTSLAATPPPVEAKSSLSATLESQSSIAHPTCEENLQSLNTVLKWAESPGDAYRMAKEREKLVFMIHVSGNFEIPGFT